MKTSEFVRCVEALGYEVDDSDDFYIRIRNNHGRLNAEIQTNRPFSIGTIHPSFTTVDLFDVLVEYARTPVKEREEPKLYTAESRVVDGDVRYLNNSNNNGRYFLGSIKSLSSFQTHFTQKELENINGINIFTSDEWIVEEVAE